MTEADNIMLMMTGLVVAIAIIGINLWFKTVKFLLKVNLVQKVLEDSVERGTEKAERKK